MPHKKTEFTTHFKVVLFAAFIGAEVGLTWLAGTNFVLNATAVVVTSYAIYILDDIYAYLFERKKK